MIDPRQFVEAGNVDDACWVSSTTSTNTVLLEESPFAGRAGLFLFGADEQTAGRGRSGRAWSANAGALTFSVQLVGRDTPNLLSLRVALAICEGVEPSMPSRGKIKWPNDVLIERRKLAGILIESRPGSGTVIGVGINVNNRIANADPLVRDRMTSISDQAGYDVDRATVLAAFLAHLSTALEADDGEIISWVRERDALLGLPIRVLDGPELKERLRGQAAGIEHDGGLAVNIAERTEVVHSGTIRVIERS